MCGRLVLTATYREKIAAIFDRVTAKEWLPPRYNITPGQRVAALITGSPDHLAWIHWGHAAASRGAEGPRRLLINARGETVDRLPTFQDAFRNRRCVVLADGFYEWQRAGRNRPQPYFFTMADQRVFALAGLLLEGEGRHECVIITTEANTLMHPIHHRMPVIFDPPAAAMWLENGTATGTAKAMLQPYPSGEMEAHPVSERVNRADSEGPALITRVSVSEQIRLF